MSGHSKWANIKRQKAVVDAKKGATYAKSSREIIVAARSGADPAANFKLRQAIDKAKAEGMPNDNIQRAIEKGSGAGGGNNLEELTYEGYGPGGVAILVRCATDNRNRTAGDIRSYFSKYGGNMGETGCVNWLFKERGEIVVESTKTIDEEELLALAVESGAEDVEVEESNNNGSYFTTFICNCQILESVKEKLAQAKASTKLQVKSGQINMVPQSTITVSDKSLANQLLKLLDMLENHDDVQQIYANFDMEAAWLEELARNG